MKKNAGIILTLCALFLFYKYIAQLFPSLIGQEFMQVYGYDGVMLAVMASSYYYSYSIMQIVAGLIIDRYSVRIPMFLAILLMSMMMLLFTHTTHFYVMCVSRALMGAGAAFATVIYMKCAAYYTTSKTFGLISSLLATATMLGAACGGAPVAILFRHVGWHAGLNMVGIAGLVMATAVLIFQRSQTVASSGDDRRMTMSNVKAVILRKDNWLLLMYSGLTFSPVAILGGLWGTPFLMVKFAATATQASFLLSIMFVGHAVGSPLWALLSVRLQRKKELMHAANCLALSAIMAIIYGHCSYDTSLFLFFLFGFSVGCFMLSFELCRELNALYIMGLAVAFINSGEGIVGSFVEPFIGHLLDQSKTGAAFTLANYQMALSILPCCFILSSCVLVFINRQRKHVVIEAYARA